MRYLLGTYDLLAGSIFIVPHLLCHEASVFVVSCHGPRHVVILYNNPGVLKSYYNLYPYTAFCKFSKDKLRKGARDCVLIVAIDQTIYQIMNGSPGV